MRIPVTGFGLKVEGYEELMNAEYERGGAEIIGIDE